MVRHLTNIFKKSLPNIILFIVAIILIYVLSGLLNSSLENSVKEEVLALLSQETYENPTFDYSIRPPKDWTKYVLAKGLPSEVVQFRETAGRLTATSTMISIYTDSSLGAPLETGLAAAISLDKEILIPLGYKISSPKKVSIGNKKFYLLEETSTTENGMRKNRYLTIHHDILLVVEVSTVKENWENVKDLFEASVSTFK